MATASAAATALRQHRGPCAFCGQKAAVVAPNGFAVAAAAPSRVAVAAYLGVAVVAVMPNAIEWSEAIGLAIVVHLRNLHISKMSKNNGW